MPNGWPHWSSVSRRLKRNSPKPRTKHPPSLAPRPHKNCPQANRTAIARRNRNRHSASRPSKTPAGGHALECRFSGRTSPPICRDAVPPSTPRHPGRIRFAKTWLKNSCFILISVQSLWSSIKAGSIVRAKQRPAGQNFYENSLLLEPCGWSPAANHSELRCLFNTPQDGTDGKTYEEPTRLHNTS